MVRRAVFVIAAALIALPAAARESRMQGGWQVLGTDQFRATIDKLVGPDAIDCGVYGLTVLEKPSRAERRQVTKCIAQARTRGVPFKYATRRIPIDSWADEVYLRSVSGQTWMLVFDLMLGDPSYQVWLKKCSSVSVDSKTLIMQGEQCEVSVP